MGEIRSLALLFGTLLFLGCERMDTVETGYPDFESAVKAEAIGDGKWIPAFLPTSATSIRELHNLDTNEEWLFFRFNATDLAALRSACQPLAGDDTVFPRKPPGNWWPADLTRDTVKREQPEGKYEYYACKGNSGMVIDRRRNEAYYWTWIR